MKTFRKILLWAAVGLCPLASFAQLNTKVGDVQFKLKFGGRTNLDFGSYLGADDGRANRNGVCVNDTRLGLTADIDTVWQAKIEVSFGSKAIAFRDVYVKRTFKSTGSDVQLGNFFFPFGMKRAGLAYKFIENSAADAAFTPWRKMGVAYQIYSPKFNWGVGLFSDGDIDKGKKTNQGYSVNAYGLLRPVDNAGTIFHVGASAIITHPSGSVSFSAVEPQTFSSSTLVKTPAMEAYNYGRLEAQALVIVRRFYAEARFLKAWVNTPNSVTAVGADGEEVEVAQDNYDGAYGFYAQASWRIFGENQNYNRKTGLAGNPNAKAMEVLARFSRTDLDQYGAANDLTLGVNYFFNKYLRAKVNYVHSHIRGGIDHDILEGRFQFSF